MLDYLYHSAVNYQKLHGYLPNLVYMNDRHLKSLQGQLQNSNEFANLFNSSEIKIVLSHTLTHPSFAYV
jgi:hypothetical protein